MKTGDTFEGQLCYGNVAVKDKVFDVAVISKPGGTCTLAMS